MPLLEKLNPRSFPNGSIQISNQLESSQKRDATYTLLCEKQANEEEEMLTPSEQSRIWLCYWYSHLCLRDMIFLTSFLFSDFF